MGVADVLATELVKLTLVPLVFLAAWSLFRGLSR